MPTGLSRCVKHIGHENMSEMQYIRSCVKVCRLSKFVHMLYMLYRLSNVVHMLYK